MLRHPPYSLILASNSPRRKELLGWLNLPFVIQASHIDEVSTHTRPSLVVQDLAKQKGKWIFDQLEQRETFGKSFFPIVIGADTLVALGSLILGKPNNDEEAKTMLTQLSDKTHQVLTGVYIGLLDRETLQYREELFCCMTEVNFAKISQDLLDDYVQSGDPLDKAGSYGIQGQALTFISSINGSYSNVVGFPLCEFVQKLKELLGYKENPGGKWRSCFYE